MWDRRFCGQVVLLAVALTASSSSPTPAALDFEVDGSVDLPLNACGAFGLLSELGEGLDQHELALNLLQSLYDAHASGAIDGATWEVLADQTVDLLDLGVEGASFGGIAILNGATTLVDVVLPHQSTTLLLPLHDMTATTLGLDGVSESDFDRFVRWVAAAQERNAELQELYDQLSDQVGPICYDSLSR